MALSAALEAHLKTGSTTLCRCWGVTRRDGVKLGFTDHDVDLSFEDFTFGAGTGLTASALEQSSGLSVNNSEALGALASAAVTEADLLAGRYDGAEILAWLVNWDRPEERVLQFRGTLGEIARGEGAFVAELRGLTEALGEPVGRVYQTACGTILGSAACGFETSMPGYFVEAPALEVLAPTRFRLSVGDGFPERWFERGRFEVLSGAAAGLVGVVKNDRIFGGDRVIELWEGLHAPVGAGDMVRIEAGCDKRAETCREKFSNFLNFQGFPDIPGEDWLLAYPVNAGKNDGGSLK